jgi:succinate dehydrogenase / fumarate reductase, cytochrome b subunit
MRNPLSLYRTTIGKKIVMALTGVILVGFVVVHMVGNLQVFAGTAKFDSYSAMLHGPLHELLILLRIVLLVSVLLHIHAAVSLILLARASRPDGYAKREPQVSTLAARTIRLSGFLLLFFIVYHILHFTTGDVHPEFIEGAAYHNLITGLQVPWVAALYIVAMIALFGHLYHGAWSVFQTLGLNHPAWNRTRRALASGLAAVTVLGFLLVPVGVLLGWFK